MSTTRASVIRGVSTAAALLLAGAAAGYWWAHKSTVNESTPAAARAPPGQAPVLYWYDPMIPNQHFDKPGKSPMGMEMVPKYADEGSGSGGIRVSSDVVQNLGIRLGKVEKANLKSGLHAVGSVVFDDRLVELVQARVEGYAPHLYVTAPLERVHRGQPFATILAPQWLEAQQEYLPLADAPAARGRASRGGGRPRLAVRA